MNNGAAANGDARNGGRTPSAVARLDRKQRYAQEMKKGGGPRSYSGSSLGSVGEGRTTQVSRDAAEGTMNAFIVRSEQNAEEERKKLAKELMEHYNQHLKQETDKKSKIKEKPKKKGNKYLIHSDYKNYTDYVNKYKQGAEPDEVNQRTPTPRSGGTLGTLPFVERSEEATATNRKKMYEKMRADLAEHEENQKNSRKQKQGGQPSLENGQPGHPMLTGGNYDGYKEYIRQERLSGWPLRSPLQESAPTDSTTNRQISDNQKPRRVR